MCCSISFILGNARGLRKNRSNPNIDMIRCFTIELTFHPTENENNPEKPFRKVKCQTDLSTHEREDTELTEIFVIG